MTSEQVNSGDGGEIGGLTDCLIAPRLIFGVVRNK